LECFVSVTTANLLKGSQVDLHWFNLGQIASIGLISGACPSLRCRHREEAYHLQPLPVESFLRLPIRVLVGLQESGLTPPGSASGAAILPSIWHHFPGITILHLHGVIILSQIHAQPSPLFSINLFPSFDSIFQSDINMICKGSASYMKWHRL
jgi:hypothetical protein